MKIKPIDTIGINLWDSVWQNIETEQIISNILIISRKMNPNEWVPFSWPDYYYKCTHHVMDWEKNVLDALVNGGKPVWNTKTLLDPGYLEMQGDKYVVTEKFLAAIERRMKMMET